MNKKEIYEITITEKLGQLPLPALEDAIWARIENSLDLEMPTDDGPGGDGGGPVNPSGGGMFPIQFGLSAFLLALISFYFLSQNKTQPAVNTPVTSRPTIETIQQDKPPDKKTQTYTPPVFQPPPGHSRGVLSPRLEDSIAQPLVNNTGVLPLPDEAVTTGIVAPPVALPKVDTLVPKKKGKGVSGITDNDYRIVPTRKDSTD
jgi:hypothetical protein